MNITFRRARFIEITRIPCQLTRLHIQLQIRDNHIAATNGFKDHTNTVVRNTRLNAGSLRYGIHSVNQRPRHVAHNIGADLGHTQRPLQLEDDALSTAFAASDADNDTATEGAEAENTTDEGALSDAFAALDTLPEPENKKAANALDDAFAELNALNADAPSTSADTPQGENEDALTDAFAALDRLGSSSEENPTKAEPSEPDASLESAFAVLGELGTPQPAEEEDDNQS